MSGLYMTIVSELKRHTDKEGVEIAKRYHKYEGYESYGLVMSLFRNLVKQHKKEILALLRKWNKSKNMWKRRASVVPFTRKVGESGTFTKDGLKLCENLVWDKED